MSYGANGPAWGYRDGEAKIFQDGILPKGWVDSPTKVKPAKAGNDTVNGGVGNDSLGGNETLVGE